jgi:hypothetical protein
MAVPSPEPVSVSSDSVNKWIEELVQRAWEPLRESIAQGLEEMADMIHSPEQDAMFAARVLDGAAKQVRDKKWDPALQSVIEMPKGAGKGDPQ